MMHLLASPPLTASERSVVSSHRCSLLPSKNRGVQPHPLNVGYNILVHAFRNRIEHFEDDVIGVCAGLWNLVLSY